MEQSRTVLSWETWTQKQQKTIVVGGKNVVIQELSGAEYDEVRNIPKPQAPLDYKKGPDGRPVLKNGIPETEPNTQDSEYLKKIEEAEIVRTLKILEYGLVEPNGKEIPGNTPQEKWAFLKVGTAGYLDKIAMEILRISALLPGDTDFLLQS